MHLTEFQLEEKKKGLAVKRANLESKAINASFGRIIDVRMIEIPRNLKAKDQKLFCKPLQLIEGEMGVDFKKYIFLGNTRWLIKYMEIKKIKTVQLI